MAIDLVKERDELSNAFGELQTRYNQSVGNIVEAFGAAVSALEAIAQEHDPATAQKTAKAALARLKQHVNFTADPSHAIRQDEINAQQPAAKPQQAQPAVAQQQPQQQAQASGAVQAGVTSGTPTNQASGGQQQQQ